MLKIRESSLSYLDEKYKNLYDANSVNVYQFFNAVVETGPHLPLHLMMFKIFDKRHKRVFIFNITWDVFGKSLEENITDIFARFNGFGDYYIVGLVDGDDIKAGQILFDKHVERIKNKTKFDNITVDLTKDDMRCLNEKCHFIEKYGLTF